MKTLKSFQMLMVLALLVTTALTGCGGPTKVDVSLTTYAVTYSTTDPIKAGDVIFHVTNDATDQIHEFVIFKTDLPGDQMPLNAEGAVDEEGAGITFMGEVEDVEIGTSQDLSLTLEPGKYVGLCNVGENVGDVVNHYTHGMYIEFTVK
ncbi:MAG TPA: hypothetical protein VFI68_14880 [Anaerolineales bacterium]|nr:hypothetical protein [Anaerolineales bacterium]